MRGSSGMPIFTLSVYEDLIAAPQTTATGLSRFLARDIAPSAVAAALARDSQAGTPQEQGARNRGEERHLGRCPRAMEF